MVNLAVLLVALQATPAPPKPFVAGPSVEGIAEYRLPNGLKLLLVPDESVAKVTVNLTVLVGSRHEGYGEKGMAHLLEHLLFKGTPTTKDPKAALTARGAQFNGTTAEDRTNYFETLSATDANAEWAIRFEADRLVNSFVARKDLDTEMSVVRNEFEGSENNGAFALRSRVRAAALPWHNYGRTVIGTRADIERVPIESLQAFYRRYYQPDNALLIVAGRFDPAKVFTWVAASFGKLSKPARALPSTFTEEPTQDGERFVTVRRVGGNPLFSAAWRIPAASDPDFPALMVLQGVLGDAPQGREHQALVDGKLAARAGCTLDQLREPGLFTCTATMRPTDAVPAVRDALLTTAEQLAKRPATQAEVDRARTGWLSELEAALDSSEEVGLGLSEWAANGDWRMMFVQRDRLKAVTAQDVASVAAKYLKAQNRTAGEYVPTEKPDRAAVPAAPEIGPLVQGYKGGEPVARGEAFEPSPANIDARTTRSTLANGAKLALLAKKTRAQTVVLSLRLRFGAAESLKGQREIASLAVQLMGRGTRKLPYKDFRSKLEQLKATLSVSPSSQAATLHLEVKRPELAEALELLFDVLKEPALDSAEFDALKKQSLAGLEQRRSEPGVLGQVELLRALTPVAKDHPLYVRTLDEQAAELGAVTVEQVRAFHGRFLGAQNADLAVVGDFDPAELKPRLEAALGGWSSKEKFTLASDPFLPSKTGEQTVATPDKAQAWIGAGLTFPLRETDPDFAPMTLANATFGGSTAARLFDVLREKQGLSYGAYSRLSVPAAPQGDRGVFFAFAIYAPQNLGKVETALKSEFARLVAEGVRPEELEARRKTLLQDRLQSRATDRELAGDLIALSEFDRTMAWEQQLDDRLEAVTVDQINAALKKYVDVSRLTLVKAGDFKTIAAPQ